MSRTLSVVAAQVRPVEWDPAATLVKFGREVRTLRAAFPDAGMYVFPEQTMSLFGRDREMLEVSVPWLHIGILGFMGFGLANNLALCLNTAGDTLIPMLTSNE